MYFNCKISEIKKMKENRKCKKVMQTQKNDNVFLKYEKGKPKIINNAYKQQEFLLNKS